MVAVVLLPSCTKESELPLSEGENTPITKAESPIATLAIELSATYESDGFRNLAFDLGTDKETPRFAPLPDVDWSTYFFIRNSTNTVQYYALGTWEVADDSSVGSIKLKLKDSKLDLVYSSGDATIQPQDKETWYITGIAGGGALNSTKTGVSFAPNTTLDSKYNPKAPLKNIRVPITFKWTAFKVGDGIGHRTPELIRAENTQVQFAPQGTLLNVSINNTQGFNGGYFNVGDADLTLQTTALSQQGVFDYSLGNTIAANSSAPKFVFDKPAGTPETISREVWVDKDTKGNVLLWGMPRTGDNAPLPSALTSSFSLAPYRLFKSDGSRDRLGAHTSGFKSGKYYNIYTNVDHPIIPLTYMARTNMKNERATQSKHSWWSLLHTQKGSRRFLQQWRRGQYRWCTIHTTQCRAVSRYTTR